MCTVTFLPTQNGVCLTSNRDEKNTRLTALPPSFYEVNDTTLMYPKDADKGGTWMAAKDNGDAAVLLNGGFIPHVSISPYRQSRGTIIPLVLSSEEPVAFFDNYNCDDIEPFTLILFSGNRLYEYRWTGVVKSRRWLDAKQSYIWSSVTLYDEATIRQRRAWFAKWKLQQTQPEQDNIMCFHRFAGDGDIANDLLMNRDGKVFTVSITSVLVGSETVTMKYEDVVKQTSYQLIQPLSHSLLQKAS